MKNSVGKKEKKSNQARKVTPKFWRTMRYVALLVVWVFCSVVVAQIMVGLILGLFLSAEQLNQPIWSGIYSLMSYIIALLLIILVPPKISAKWRLKIRKDSKTRVVAGEKSTALVTREQLGLTDLPTWTDIGLAPIAYIISTLLALGLVWLFSLFPWFNAEQSQSTGFGPYMNSGEKAVAFMVLVILAPIVEEIIFRGWLYGKLRARMGVVASILIVSVLFGLMHFQWNVAVNVFALSVVACVLREITGTIYAGILTHMIKNGVAFYLLYVIGFG